MEGWGSQESVFSSSVRRPLRCVCFRGELERTPRSQAVLGLSGSQPVEGAGNMCPLSISTDGASKQS